MAALLKVKAVKAGLVAIRGHETGLYLAMDKYGKLYGTVSLKNCFYIKCNVILITKINIFNVLNLIFINTYSHLYRVEFLKLEHDV